MRIGEEQNSMAAIEQTHTGQLVLRKWDDRDPRLEVVQADPQIRIDSLLHEEMLLSRNPEWGSYDGEVLKVTGRNWSVVYRVIGYDEKNGQYLAEWPD